MGRILGRVEYGGKIAPRYFIHCDTAGQSFPPLFAEPQAAWKAYDDGDVDGLYASVPSESSMVRVVRKTLAWGRSFDIDGKPYGHVRYGLASADRLLTHTEQSCEPKYAFLRRDGLLHVAIEVNDMMGSYDEPICTEQWRPNAADVRLPFEAFYARDVELCPQCVAKLISRN